MVDFDTHYIVSFRNLWVNKVSVSCLYHLFLKNYKLYRGTKVPLYGINGLIPTPATQMRTRYREESVNHPVSCLPKCIFSCLNVLYASMGRRTEPAGGEHPEIEKYKHKEVDRTLSIFSSPTCFYRGEGGGGVPFPSIHPRKGGWGRKGRGAEG